MVVIDSARRVAVVSAALALSFACRDRVQGASPSLHAADRTLEPPATGIWVGRDELAARPTSGPAWEAVRRDAERDPGKAEVRDQDSMHDTYVMAAALVCARTGEFCDKAKAELVEAIGTERGADWLSVGRNVGAYAIAADLLGLRADGNASSAGTKVQAWLANFLTRDDIRANRGEDASGTRAIAPFHSGSNAAAQEGFVHAAIAAYLGDRKALDRAWDGFRVFVCDSGVPDRERIDLGKGVEAGWTHDASEPCAINPRGASKTVPAGMPGAGQTYRIDGAIINDMRRGGDYQWPPRPTQYPWVGLEGLVPAAVILQRAGHPAFAAGDRALLRAFEYLWYLRERTGDDDWFDGRRGSETTWIVNQAYGTSFPARTGVGAGRTFGYSDWTHMTWRPSPREATAAP